MRKLLGHLVSYLSGFTLALAFIVGCGGSKTADNKSAKYTIKLYRPETSIAYEWQTDYWISGASMGALVSFTDKASGKKIYVSGTLVITENE